MVIFGACVPQLRSLPIHGADETANHRPRRLFHLREPKVCYFGGHLGRDENVRGLEITVDDRWVVMVQVLNAVGDVEHEVRLNQGVSLWTRIRVNKVRTTLRREGAGTLRM